MLMYDYDRGLGVRHEYNRRTPANGMSIDVQGKVTPLLTRFDGNWVRNIHVVVLNLRAIRTAQKGLADARRPISAVGVEPLYKMLGGGFIRGTTPSPANPARPRRRLPTRSLKLQLHPQFPHHVR